MNARLHNAPNARRGFTLVELMVVIVIVSILSALSLAGLARAGNRSKADTSKYMIRKLSTAIMDYYESYEDLALAGIPLTTLRARMREELPDCWADVGRTTPLLTGTTGMGRAYQRYKAALNPSSAYQSAECLYMIVTESGLCPTFLEGIKADRIGDIDNDNAKEFWDGWGRPIAFIRWAPGFTSPPYATIQVADAQNFHDPLDVNYDPGPPAVGADVNAFALYPLIFSAGPDEALNDPMSSEASGYGLLWSDSGWPDTQLGNICGFNPDGKGLVGVADPKNPTACKDNITNHDLIME